MQASLLHQRGRPLATPARALLHHFGLVLLALVALGAIATLMGTVFNGFAFGYIAYKSRRLGPPLQDHLHLPSNPLTASQFIGESPAGRPILLGTLLLTASLTLLSVLLLAAGTTLLWTSPDGHGPLFWLAVIPATLLFAAGLTGSILTLLALDRQRRPAAVSSDPPTS